MSEKSPTVKSPGIKKSYHFSLGNSTKGAVGYCARVIATSKEEAVEKLKAAIPEDQPVTPYTDDDAIDYFEVYFNENAITVEDIDEINDIDDETGALL